VAGIGRLGVASPYWIVLEEISKKEAVPLVDSSALIVEARKKVEDDLERRLGLQSPTTERGLTSEEIVVIFRVYLGSSPVPRSMYIVGTHPKLGNLIPNKVAMYDDGTHGDQRAGDTVWTYAATFSPGTKLFYVYTNSGEKGQWEGLDVPHIRAFRAHAPNGEGQVYRPIESFGEIYMQADGWHTNAAGYKLIVKTLRVVLKEHERVKEYLSVSSRP
jgi:hypothetical protein